MNQQEIKAQWDDEYRGDIDRVLESIEEEAAAARRFLSESKYEAVYSSLKYISREADGWAKDLKKDGLNKEEE